MALIKQTTPPVFVRVINSRKQTADLDRMVPVHASHFSIEELTQIYNRARIDYVIPMPMSPRRLQEHIQTYGILLPQSTVMVDTILSEPVGLGLLGSRGPRAWISRFGLVPLVRGQGYALAMMAQLLKTAGEMGAERVYVEVLQDNRPGLGLSRRMGFEPLRELIMARRPPDLSRQVLVDPAAEINEVSGRAARQLLNQRTDQPSWLNQSESFAVLNLKRLKGLCWRHADGRVGWVVYEEGRYQLKRVTVGVMAGDDAAVTSEVLHALHRLNPQKDAVIEDIPADDRRWPGYQAAGYFETYRRVECVKELKGKEERRKGKGKRQKRED